MTQRTASRLAWTIFVVNVASMGAAVVLGLTRTQGSRVPEAFVFTPAFVSFSLVGALIVARRKENWIGWLFLIMGNGFGVPAGAYVNHELALGSTSSLIAWGAWLQVVSIEIGLAPLVLTLMLFPNGHLLSRRWRIAAWGTALVGAIGMLSTAVSDVNLHNNFPTVKHPLALLPATIIEPIYSISQLAGLLFLALGAVAIVIRFRRSRGEEREQVKWMAFAGTLVAVMLFALAILPLGAEPVWAFILFVPLIPIAAGIAILKYHLYDIDIVINKTVVYGALATFITLVYVVIVVGVGALIGQGDRPNVALSIVATAVIAVAFQPARERVQRFANRLVYGSRATPYEILREFSERMGGAYANEDLLPRMARVMAEGTGAARAEVWLRIGGSVRLTAAWPDSGLAAGTVSIPLVDEELPAMDGVDRAVAVRHQSELLGAVTVTKAPGDPLGHTEEVLLDDLAGQAGLVLSNVRLTAELEARLDDITVRSIELRASRQRIVAAQDEERRRLERNIHDGAQQHLVALAVKLRLAKALVTRDPAKAAVMLNELRDQVGDALDTLSSLALGVYPPLLEEQGIAPALAAQYERSNLPVHLDADVARYPIDVEAAVYFCVLEALQNIAKYAAAARIDIMLRGGADELMFEVTDDGRGFDPATTPRGAGLDNMTDRLSVLGGGVTIESTPGSGTTVLGRIPLGAMAVVR